MKFDDFSFINNQLSMLLNDGVPLPVAIKHLSKEIKDKKLKADYLALENDLSNGVSLEQAVKQRNFPSLYKSMITIGVSSNNLSGVLLLVSQYFLKVSSLGQKLKTLFIYPYFILIVSFCFSLVIPLIFSPFMESYSDIIGDGILSDSYSSETSTNHFISLYSPSIFIGFLLCAITIILLSTNIKQKLLWKLPTSKDIQLAHLAHSLNMLMSGGCSFKDSISIVSELENNTLIGNELSSILKNMSEGNLNIEEAVPANSILPPIFIWSISANQQNQNMGLQKTIEIYEQRADYKFEMFLYAFLPSLIIVLGLLTVGQLIYFFKIFSDIFTVLTYI
jgi:type II secretory pathway component PulF